MIQHLGQKIRFDKLEFDREELIYQIRMFEDYTVQPPVIKTELWAIRIIDTTINVHCQTLYEVSLQKDISKPITRTLTVHLSDFWP